MKFYSNKSREIENKHLSSVWSTDWLATATTVVLHSYTAELETARNKKIKIMQIITSSTNTVNVRFL